jgi:hypothetical protein
MEPKPQFTKWGRFSIVPDREVHGELHVAGSDTFIYLQDDKEFEPRSLMGKSYTGTLYDLTNVTLIKCTLLEGLGHSGLRNEKQYYYAKLFPHFVIQGERHINPDENVILESRFVIDDAPNLFYDFDAFGQVLNAGPLIEQVAAANKLDRPVPIGPEPRIAYFAGKRTIVEAETVLGRVRVRHNPWPNLAGPRGVRIDNTITVEIRHNSPATFDEAILGILRLLRFLELIVGRSQNLLNVTMYVDDGELWAPLKVHWSYCPSRDPELGNKRSPHPADLLLDAIDRQEEFINVLTKWLETEQERRDARYRFHTCFTQKAYTVDRLVAAANVFDILPPSATPSDVELSKEVLDAKERCRQIFRDLPAGDERDSVLGALGRVGKASLKHKVRYRAQLVIDKVGERFPELDLVLDAVVDCRNHYVHGTPSRIDYAKHFDVVIFFTNTLEFVFAASELVEAGWDIQAFINTGTTMSHPFGEYRVEYRNQLQFLKSLR